MKVNIKNSIKTSRKYGWSEAFCLFIGVLIMSYLIGFLICPSAESAEKGVKTHDGLEDLVIDTVMGDLANRFFGNIDIGYTHSFWEINADEKKPIFEYKAEGLELVKFIGNLGYGYSPLLTVWYETSPSPSSRQEEMLRFRKEQESNVELFKGQVAADALIMYLLPGDSLLKEFLRNLLSLRYRYTRELFYGEATALEDTFYIPDGADLNYNSGITSGAVPIEAGVNAEFRTVFEESEISTRLLKFDYPIFSGRYISKIAKYSLKLGYYQSVWERPSSTRNFTIDSRPVSYNAKYRSRGLVIGMETSDIGSPGFNCDLSLKTGYDDKYENPIDWKSIYGKSVAAKSSILDIRMWYNIYLSGDRSYGWFITFGGLWSHRSMDVVAEVETKEGTQFGAAIHDTDETRNIYATIAYRF